MTHVVATAPCLILHPFAMFKPKPLLCRLLWTSTHRYILSYFQAYLYYL